MTGLALERIKIGNRPRKGFKVKGWKNIINRFKEKTGITYDKAQFKNSYDKLRGSWQAWRGLTSNIGKGYDPDPKTFTTDEQRLQDIIKVSISKFRHIVVKLRYNPMLKVTLLLAQANPEVKEFRIKPLPII